MTLAHAINEMFNAGNVDSSNPFIQLNIIMCDLLKTDLR